MSNTRASGRKGFTFTLSMVILSLTLVTVATFAQEWRKDQQASYTEILPSESMRLRERVSADMNQILQLEASLDRRNDSTTKLSFAVTEPFKREGLSIARMTDYSESLPANLRNLGVEAVFSANNITGSDTAVLHTTGNGSLVYSNDGPYDITTFYYPSGMSPGIIRADIVCDKISATVSDLSVESNPNSGYGYYYIVNYTEKGGRNFVKTYYAQNESNATMSVIYPDASLLYFESRFSPSLGSNRTSVHYTKSSGGALILPFDSNSSGGVLRDYSIFPENISFTPGSSPPTWKADCGRGTGCYYFDGEDNSIYLPYGLALTDSEVPVPIGSERIVDPWLEEFAIPVSPDDAQDDFWKWWYKDSSSTATFDATVENAQAGASVKITPSVSGSTTCLYQTVSQISPSSPYVFSFWSKGDPARYKIELTDGKCLLANGSWSMDACTMFIDTPLSPDSYRRVSKTFTTPYGMSLSLKLSLCASAALGSNVYYDSISLKKAVGINGGFESYYYQSDYQNWN